MKQGRKRLNKGKTLGFFLLFFSCVPSFNAQQIRVVNEMFEPLDEVGVCNILETKCTHTGYKGNTNISEFGINDTLVFTIESYKPQKLTVATILNEGRWVIMEPTSNMLSGVQIIAPLRNENRNNGKSTNQTEIISAEELEELNAQTTADVLQNADGIQVQKSQMGGGSPIIRGFEANRVLLLIDGVRLNNAIYRGGHLHNSVTVDNNVLSQVEILYGPGSAVYGSDAIGGVVHFHTKDPKLSKGDSIIIGGSGMLRYNSANHEKSGHFDISIGGKKFGSITSVSANDFGDLLSGSKRVHGYDDFGNINIYAQRVDGKDSALINENPNLQIGTAYKQVDLLQKLIYRHSEKVTFKLNTQYSNSTDVPRFDRLNNVKEDGMLEYSEWYYGPQERMFASFKTELSASNFFFSKASFIASAQNINEDRVKRLFGSNSRSSNNENVKVYGFNVDLVRAIDSASQLFYGLELTHNDLVSTAFTEDIVTGEMGSESTRYPDGGSEMSTGAFYLSYARAFKKVITKVGGRYNYNNLRARFVDESFVALPFDVINSTSRALSGNFGMVYLPTKSFKSNFNISTGFRSPNIDDFGKVFKKGDFVVIPNNNIKPEYAYSAELGFSKTFQREYHSN
jgi:hemoglobin/transferrin/lactoferrin receptor protein